MDAQERFGDVDEVMEAPMFMAWMKPFLSPPDFENEEKTRVARMLNTMLLSTIGILGTVVLTPLFAGDLQRRLAMEGGFALLACIAVFLTKRGHLRTATALFLFGIWMGFTLAASTAGGIHSPAFAAYMLFIVSAGLLKGRRVLIASVVISILSGICLAFAEQHGFLPRARVVHTLVTLTGTYSAIFLLVAVLLGIALRNLHEALERSRQEIRQRMRVEAELRQVSERLALATSSAGIGIWDWDVVHNTLVWDDSMYHLYAVGRDDFQGTSDSWTHTLHPDDREQTEAEVQAALRGEREFNAEFRVLWPDGSTRFMKSAAQTFRDQDRHPLRMVGVSYDVTERVQMEQALRASEQRFRTLIEEAPIAVSVTRNGLGVYANRRLLEMMGVSDPSDLIGRPELKLFAPRARQEVVERSHERGLGLPVASEFESVLLRADGTEFPAHLAVATVDLTVGPAQVAFLLDISERKQAEQERQASEKRFQMLIEQAPMAISITRNAAGLYANPRLLRMLGLTRCEEFVGRPASELFAPCARAESVERSRRRTLGLPVPQEFESILQRMDGTEFPAHLSVGTVHLADGLANVAFISDITEQKRAEENQALLASIVQSSIDPIIATSLDGAIVTWNPAATRLFKYTEAEILGQQISLLSPANRMEELHSIYERIARGEATELFDTFRQNKAGHLVDVLLSVFPIKTPSGQIVGAAANVRDIRELKQVQRQLNQQIRRLSALRIIDSAIIDATDLEAAANEILEQIRNTLSVDAASLLLLDPQLQTLDFVAGAGFRSAEIRRTHLRVGEDVTGRTVLTRRAFFANTLIESSELFTRTELLAAERFIGYTAIPLLAKGQIMGILEVFHREPLTLAPDEWEFLESLAHQAAIAIDNTRLFADLQHSNTELILAYDATIEGWARALDLRDKETEGHSRRVTQMTLQLAQALQISHDEIVHIRRGALLHDIGKMGIPDSVLLKPASLTDDEWKVMQQHPVYAFEMLAPIHFLRPALDIPYCHHERWDGAGYPRGLKGEAIPLAARIFAVVDIWDALRSKRPYRDAWPVERVLEHIRSLAGTHLDARVVEAFLKLDPRTFPKLD